MLTAYLTDVLRRLPAISPTDTAAIRPVPFKVGSTDAVHIYSDAQRILLQLRRLVPTEHKPSFKVALTLTPEQATAIAGELLTAAKRKASPQSSTAGKQPPKAKPPSRGPRR